MAIILTNKKEPTINSIIIHKRNVFTIWTQAIGISGCLAVKLFIQPD